MAFLVLCLNIHTTSHTQTHMDDSYVYRDTFANGYEDKDWNWVWAWKREIDLWEKWTAVQFYLVSWMIWLDSLTIDSCELRRHPHTNTHTHIGGYVWDEEIEVHIAL